jgi:hypothetical protein
MSELDQTSSAEGPARCPWCSAELPPGDLSDCPSCGATLGTEGEPQVPGVTALDVQRLATGRSAPPKRSRILSWLSGDEDDDAGTVVRPAPGSLSPPPLEVRREMLKMELAAEGVEVSAAPEDADVAAAADEKAEDPTDPAADAARAGETPGSPPPEAG